MSTILKDVTYKEMLELLGLETLEVRRLRRLSELV